jgi:tetratricopeptide (TPR) repeat protein
MVPSYRILILMPLRALGQVIAFRPKTSLAILVLILAVVAWSGLLAWRAYHFHAAQKALHDDRLTEALHHLDRCPASSAVCLLAARIHRLRSEFSLVEKNLKECKRLQGGMSERLQLEWTLLGAHMGDLDSVEEQLLYYVQNNHPQADLVYESLAFAYMQNLRYGAALWCLDQWLKRNPDSIRALAWRGWTRNRMEFRQGALEDFTEVLNRAPDHWQTRLRLAQLYLAEAMPQKAKVDLDKLVFDHPEQPEVKVALARYEITQNRGARARIILDCVLDEQPQFMPALYLRATLEENLPLREKRLRKILRDGPGNLEARFALVLCLNQQNRRREASVELDLYNQTKKDLETLTTLFKKVERSPRDPDLLVQTGKILLRTDKVLGQVFLFKAMEIDPDHREAKQALAQYQETDNSKRPGPGLKRGR